MPKTAKAKAILSLVKASGKQFAASNGKTKTAWARLRMILSLAYIRALATGGYKVKYHAENVVTDPATIAACQKLKCLMTPDPGELCDFPGCVNQATGRVIDCPCGKRHSYCDLHGGNAGE